MLIEGYPPLWEYAEWIRATDGHAAHHLRLLDRARAALDRARPETPGHRVDLAARLERWRYQVLNERQVAPQAGRLADALDLTANDLRGRPARAPRSPRSALRDPTLDTPDMREAWAALDPQTSLEEVAARAAALTREHFSAPLLGVGLAAKRRMLLYAPIYLSSHCVNHCVYCGFRYPEAIERRHLGPDQALCEAEVLRDRGFRHVLLVAGEFPSLTTTDYFAGILKMLAERGFQPAVEIAPQPTRSYAELHTAGALGVTLYQETYDEALYSAYHPRGTKASYDWRLEGIERAAEAGMRRLGLGILLGLGDPRTDVVALLRHARYLQERFPDRTLALSLPRIREAPAGFQGPFPVDDHTLVRLYCVLRIAQPRADLVLSTREAPELRNRLARICITQLSAGSSTVPGGYGLAGPPSLQSSGGQFPVADHRSPAEVADWLAREGFQVAWEIP